eukprot:Gb_07745 [translate_table: standard]
MAHLPAVPRIKLGSQGLEVSAQGLGCMGMSSAYGPPKPEQEMIDLIHYAVDKGVTFLDTADVYGPHTNEILLGKAIKGIRHKVQIGTKFGARADLPKAQGDPAYVRAACEASLKRLDIDCIDLYYQHRVDVAVPIEVTMGELKKLVEEGKIKYVGLSEPSASTIRRAHAVHPITAVQVEWSLWTRDVEEQIISTCSSFINVCQEARAQLWLSGACRELGIGIVAFSPVARGFFASGGKLVESLTAGDRRKILPRFQEENLQQNIALFQRLTEISSRKGCSPVQLALAWVQHQGNDVSTIPGTTKVKNLEENIACFNVKLTAEDLKEIEDAFPVNAAAGDRYPASMNLTWKNSDTPPYHAA